MGHCLSLCRGCSRSATTRFHAYDGGAEQGEIEDRYSPDSIYGRNDKIFQNYWRHTVNAVIPFCQIAEGKCINLGVPKEINQNIHIQEERQDSICECPLSKYECFISDNEV
ncbi:hypothetical protein Bhyg_04617 [Pseudolycoriella hygida]|uniref:Uncharacterized protein n=1 Tax=Pseudolycoriella hygida TaxID=35572 RepID=A0A9Q0NFL9_9DIPT|nr:hypothetical protein Bhyg_04617 [Pseudolycoriella hygida]